jgi:hypothetical protein
MPRTTAQSQCQKGDGWSEMGGAYSALIKIGAIFV